MKRSLCFAFAFSTVVSLAAAEPHIESAASADSVVCYDFVEITLSITNSAGASPSTEAEVTGTFGPSGGATLAVSGFCDAADGSVFRIRFMPTQPGRHEYAISYRDGAVARTLTGGFEATDGRRRGLLRVDPAYPAHLQWAGTQERFFWNGMACDKILHLDETALRSHVEHLDRSRITGLRVALATPTDPFLSDLASWSQLERLITLARARDIAVAVVFPSVQNPSDAQNDPPWIAYATARLAAFSNILWEPAAPSERLNTAFAASDPYGRAAAGFGNVLPLEQDLRSAWQLGLSGRYSTVDACLQPDGTSDTVLADALERRGHLFDLFTGITWWELQGDDSLVVSHQPQAAEAGTFAARNAQGDLAVIHVRGGGVVTLKGELLTDQLKPVWFSPRDGGTRNARALRSRVYRTPTTDDWVLLFRTPCNCSFRDFDNEYE